MSDLLSKNFAAIEQALNTLYEKQFDLQIQLQELRSSLATAEQEIAELQELKAQIGNETLPDEE